jgi:hypothetical protein
MTAQRRLSAFVCGAPTNAKSRQVAAEPVAAAASACQGLKEADEREVMR